MFCQRKFGRGVRLKPAVALQMLGLEVGKDERIKRNAFMPVLERSFRGQLDDRVRTAAVHGAPQKFLQEEAPRYGHLVEITLTLFSHDKTDGEGGGAPFCA